MRVLGGRERGVGGGIRFSGVFGGALEGLEKESETR